MYGGIDRAVCFVMVTVLGVNAGDTHGRARSAVPSLKKNGEGEKNRRFGGID